MTREPTQPHPGQARRLFAEAYDAAAGLSSSLPRALGALANEARVGLDGPGTALARRDLLDRAERAVIATGMIEAGSPWTRLGGGVPGMRCFDGIRPPSAEVEFRVPIEADRGS